MEFKTEKNIDFSVIKIDTPAVTDEIIIHTKIKADGFDGAITMCLIDINSEKSYSPGIYSSYPSY